jgi:HEAT repeat protein/beta-lactamase regulating signal transducer with metallopeptidase domain
MPIKEGKMIGLDSMLLQSLTHALGWALLHFIWQGTAIAVVLAGVLFVLQNYAARLRYGVALGALMLMPVFLFITMRQVWATSQEIAVYSAKTLRTPTSSGLTPAPETTANVMTVSLENNAIVEPPRAPERRNPWTIAQLEPSLPWVVSAWLVGVLALSLRLLVGWRRAQRLKRCGITAVVANWRGDLTHLRRKMKATRPVCLLESTLVQVPTVIGWLRPVILLPVSALTGLTPPQLEAILAHELAHIKRYDYLFNLIQTVIETLLFYHPAVWWVGRQIRIEREHCCDDLAVAACGDALTYARALTELEQMRSASLRLAMAANNGSLLNRVRRLLKPPRKQLDPLDRRVAGVLVIAAVCLTGLTVYLSGASTAAAGFKEPELIRLEGKPEQLITALRDESKQARQQAAYALSQTRDKAAVPALIGALRDESKQVRLYAAYALNHISEQATVLTLAETLGDGSSGEIRLQAAYALHYIPDEAAMLPLIEALGNSSEERRLHAAYTLSYIPDKTAVPALIEKLKDESEKVRLMAACTLSYIPDTMAVPALIEALEDKSAQVRQQAAYALGRIGDKAAVPALINTLQDTSEQARQQAAHALGRVGDRAALSALMEALSDPFEQVRLQAAYALGRMPDRTATPVLIAALRDKSERVRQQTAYALGRIGDRTAIPALTEALRDESEPVRRQAAEALNRLKG